MNAWLYYRLSRDDDPELNSLSNQKSIIENYAKDNGFEIVGESFDDNVSGMHFNREGIDQITEAAEQGIMDTIVVKDLSRLGRHRTQTALFIDYLTSKGIRVVSVSESIDTSNENDDLIIGMKQLINDMYAKDISRKIHSAYRQKQKEGFVLTPPFGYLKDKYTGEIIVVEEAAETVKMIFKLYCDGYGFKGIARILNEQQRKTPAMVFQEYAKRRIAETWSNPCKKGVWIYTSVKRILENEAYIGTLINHKTETRSINKTRKFMSEDELFRKENVYPAIVEKEVWDEVQMLFHQKKKHTIRNAPGRPTNRYTGLIVCGDCGARMNAKRRKWKDYEYVEYICATNNRYGIQYCTSHHIKEEIIDKLIYEELLATKTYAKKNWQKIEKNITKWLSQNSNIEAQVNRLQARFAEIGEEVEKILMERILDKEHEQIYNEMIEKRKAEQERVVQQIEAYRDADDSVKKKRREVKRNIDLLDDIIKSGSISNAHIRMLVDQVIVRENKTTKEMNLEIVLNAPFCQHYDEYDGIENLIGKWMDVRFDEAI